MTRTHSAFGLGFTIQWGYQFSYYSIIGFLLNLGMHPYIKSFAIRWPNLSEARISIGKPMKTTIKNF